MVSTFTAEGIALAAKRLGVDVPTVRAVAEVESNGVGFLPDGRPKILFERHIFSRLTERTRKEAPPPVDPRPDRRRADLLPRGDRPGGEPTQAGDAEAEGGEARFY